jgi:DnaJ-domain-containing protein 1
MSTIPDPVAEFVENEQWHVIEAEHRRKSAEFTKLAEQAKAEGDKIEGTEPRDERKRTNCYRRQIRFLLLAKQYDSLADKARKNRWIDYAQRKLAELYNNVGLKS